MRAAGVEVRAWGCAGGGPVGGGRFGARGGGGGRRRVGGLVMKFVSQELGRRKGKKLGGKTNQSLSGMIL